MTAMRIDDTESHTRTARAVIEHAELHRLIAAAVAAESGFPLTPQTEVKVFLRKNDRGWGFEDSAEVTLTNQLTPATVPQPGEAT